MISFEAGFVDRHAARIQQAILALVDVQAEDVVAQFRQAGAGDEADVAVTSTPLDDYAPPRGRVQASASERRGA
jgi:hypothetical protein